MLLGGPYKSDIRDSEVRALLERVAKRNYSSYLIGLNLTRVRSYTDQQIQFPFPVTALVGPNGGGKTTVLGAAALIYRDVPPKRFFAKSGKYDKSMQNWKIEYELLEKSISSSMLKRTASYLKSKWNRDAVSRRVLIFGVTRTLPASERKELARCIAGSFDGFGETKLGSDSVQAVEQILGKKADNYLLVDTDSARKIKLYAANTSDGDSYSEFHFGAGEASVIRIVSAIEETPEGSLILIEEIENGLHPLASRRLVEYLISVARRKSCQIIFTTHSNDAIAPLPDEAVWSCGNGQLTQGKLDVNALRTLTGEVQANLAIFTEDEFAVEMTVAALRNYTQRNSIPLAGVAIHSLGGWSNAKKLTLSHNENPSISFPAICILDGDQSHESDPSKAIVHFPGDSDPELHVAQQVAKILDVVAARLCVAFNLTTDQQTRVRSVIQHRINMCTDPHLLFAQIGEDLDFTSEITVARAFLAQWSQNFPDEVDEIFVPVSHLLPHPPTEVDMAADSEF